MHVTSGNVGPPLRMPRRTRVPVSLACRRILFTCVLTKNRLKVPLPDVVRMQTRQPNLEGAGEISLRHLVREALRMRRSGLWLVKSVNRSASIC